MTRYQFRLRIDGPNVDPAEVSVTIGLNPARSFGIGDRIGETTRRQAGWHWYSRWTPDDQELSRELVETFAPHIEFLQSLVSQDAQVGLTIVGDVGATYVSSPEEAIRLRYAADAPMDTYPFLASDAVAISLGTDILSLFASLGGSIDTHVDPVLQG
jgi:hypothetical protein